MLQDLFQWHGGGVGVDDKVEVENTKIPGSLLMDVPLINMAPFGTANCPPTPLPLQQKEMFAA